MSSTPYISFKTLWSLFVVLCWSCSWYSLPGLVLGAALLLVSLSSDKQELVMEVELTTSSVPRGDCFGKSLCRFPRHECPRGGWSVEGQGLASDFTDALMLLCRIWIEGSLGGV